MPTPFCRMPSDFARGEKQTMHEPSHSCWHSFAGISCGHSLAAFSCSIFLLAFRFSKTTGSRVCGSSFLNSARSLRSVRLRANLRDRERTKNVSKALRFAFANVAFDVHFRFAVGRTDAQCGFGNRANAEDVVEISHQPFRCASTQTHDPPFFHARFKQQCRVAHHQQERNECCCSQPKNHENSHGPHHRRTTKIDQIHVASFACCVPMLDLRAARCQKSRCH